METYLLTAETVNYASCIISSPFVKLSAFAHHKYCDSYVFQTALGAHSINHSTDCVQYNLITLFGV